jgi:hypothetical protein
MFPDDQGHAGWIGDTFNYAADGFVASVTNKTSPMYLILVNLRVIQWLFFSETIYMETIYNAEN